MSKISPDPQKADAVLRLATSLFDYGQHQRVLALLDLHDWLADDQNASLILRIQTLLKLMQFAEARQVCERTTIILPSNLLAQIHWGLGEKSLGDTQFRSLTTI
jgi:hypothetical protein